ncbi:MAG: folylpolyglutamate synthase/dihydrofolate synthase family protein [Bryobacteraceae bacterium]|nr:folylpolyglutamate synthase/dihydrofolate synthase family protein [Bryobacteraceae bacterium]
MNSYPDSVRFLYALGNEIKAAKFGLETIERLLAALDYPQRACQWVHVAGTNGKGSTCAMIEAGLRSAGVRTGLYTSPHLVEPTERIQIGGEAVTAEEFARAFETVHRAAERMLDDGVIANHPTYFETVTAMAFLLYRDKQVETVVLEVGLGGRLDATNVVMPVLCVITPIDFDHESFLGNTIESIAFEKAGILKPAVPVVMGSQRPEAERVIVKRAAELGCRVIRAADHQPQVRAGAYGSELEWPGLRLWCPFAGLHQVDNATAAMLALRELGLSDEAIGEGMAKARWPGRLERVCAQPEIILDGAHNPAGARALAAHMARFYAGRKIWLIYGAMRDKSVGEIAETLFPLAQELILTAPQAPRALDPRSLLGVCGHRKARATSRLGEALGIVKQEAQPGDAVFITGSLFLVGEARALLVQ